MAFFCHGLMSMVAASKMTVVWLLSVCLEQSDSQQKRETTPEDSDLDRKRRETEALLQSIGISPEPPLGTLSSCTVLNNG